MAVLLLAASGVVLPLRPRVAPRHALLATATALDDFQAENHAARRGGH